MMIDGFFRKEAKRTRNVNFSWFLDFLKQLLIYGCESRKSQGRSVRRQISS